MAVTGNYVGSDVHPHAACCQVSVESPEVLVPLISSLGSAWIWTVDQRLGLFSGTRHASRTGVESELADSKQDDAVPVHNEPTLQVSGTHKPSVLCPTAVQVTTCSTGEPTPLTAYTAQV